jgi:hypothetical protein
MANYGMKRAEVLDGNVGYLQITAFYRADESTETLETVMNFVSHTDALILDLLEKRGWITRHSNTAPELFLQTAQSSAVLRSSPVRRTDHLHRASGGGCLSG